MSFDDEDLMEELIIESVEHLTKIEPDLLVLEKDGDSVDPELVNRIFRAMHSIKGGFAFFAMSHIVDLAHAMESVLMRVREGESTVSPEMTDALLAGIDKLGVLLDDVNSSESVSIDAEVKPLNDILDGSSPSEAPSDDTATDEISGKETPTEATNAEAQPNEISATESVSAPGDKENAEQPLKAVEQGNVSATQQGTDNTESSATPDKSPQLEVVNSSAVAPAKATKRPDKSSEHSDTIRVRVDLLDNLMNLAGELVLGRNQIKLALNSRISETSTAQSGVKRLEDELTRSRETIVVSQQNNKLGLVIDREFEKIRAAFDQAMSARAIDTPGMSAVMQDVDMVTSELQSGIMNTRMQAVGSVFTKFPRIMRDLSKKMNKEIDLVLIGQDVELDKSIIEALGDPLTHLVRNSADHGIEMPHDRENDGKPSTGQVCIRAYHESGQVNIDITDDGKGLDAEALKQKAIEKNILTPEGAVKLTEREAHRLIFAPGFSTAKEISDVSGRGVGMDVVKTNIEELGGTVEVESTLGQGTRINLRLPLTLAIIPSLIIGAQKRRYAVPQVNLVELVRVRGQEEDKRIENIRGKSLLRLRGKLLPLVDLQSLLSIVDDKPEIIVEDREKETEPLLDEADAPDDTSEMLPEQETPDNAVEVDDTKTPTLQMTPPGQIVFDGHKAYNILVLKVAENRYGLIVDELLDNEEIVVKPLSSYLKECKHYAGSTIMGDGRVAMILDAAGIAQVAELRFSEIEEETLQAAERKSDSGKEIQPLLLFRAGSSELFAVSLGLVSRIEKVKYSEVERVGDKEFVKYDDSSMRIIHLHHVLPIESPTEEEKDFFIIVPKTLKNPMGIIASEVVDILHVDAKIDHYNVSGKGIIGSSVLNSNLVVFLDIYGLFEAIDPVVYSVYEGIDNKLDGLNVLLVEDSAFFQSVETEYLHSSGCIVDLAENGAVALEKLKESNYDLVITDIQMPVMDGYELGEKIRAIKELDIMPIIAVTSLFCEESQKKALETGFDAYEMKLDKNKLIETVTEVLTKRQKEKLWTSNTQHSMSAAAVSE